MKAPACVSRGSPPDAGIDDVCECFESAWCRGAPLSIEEVLLRADAAIDRAALLEELIAVEIELRRDLGEVPGAEDYASRFPDHRSEIPRLFQDSSQAVAPLSLFTPATPEPLDVEVPGFQLLEEIGRGGMAVVYKAYDLSLNRLVALKLIDHDRCPSTFNHRQLEREAKSIAQLRHPGIVQIHGIGEHQGRPYLILELVNGRGLNEWLDDQGESPGWSAHLIGRIARAVDHAHRQGVIHRDLKPANILLTSPQADDSGSSTDQDPLLPVVTDFGLAKQLFAGDTISGEGALFGTPSYMPPEQSEGRSFEATPASDVYSLGAILYEMLTGRPPFVGVTQLETLRMIGRDQPTAPRRLAPQVPPALETICLTCLEKAPQRRYPSAAALAEELERSIVRHGLSPQRHVALQVVGRGRFRDALAAGFSAVSGWLGTDARRAG